VRGIFNFVIPKCAARYFLNDKIKNSLPKKRFKKGINLIPFLNEFSSAFHKCIRGADSNFDLFALFFVL
jgi:hypothetical protein